MNSPIISPTTAAVFVAAMCVAFPAARLPGDPFSHVSDGQFTSPNEWTGPTVAKSFFPVQGQAGGAYLYVEQGFTAPPASIDFSPLDMPRAIGMNRAQLPLPEPATRSPNTLFLMYDWVNSNNVFQPGSTSVFFDVFFEVNRSSDPTDYLVRIFPNSSNNFVAFERPHGSTPPLNSDGSFDISSNSGWISLSSQDLALANFRTAIGFGMSPDFSSGHVLTEFQLDINNSGDPMNPNGLYDPNPAFWSASVEGRGTSSLDKKGDPPISSGIFRLNPDGSTTVVPQFDSTGAPAKIPSQAVPEPATLLLLAAGMLMLLVRGVSRRSLC